MPRAVEVTAHEVHEALKPALMAIVNSVKMVLERTQPELAAELMERGVCMCGGTSLLKGLPELISRETGLPVRLAVDPMTCVARGCAALLDDLDAIKQILEIGTDS
jgi:rod shape-determining protein MreB